MQLKTKKFMQCCILLLKEVFLDSRLFRYLNKKIFSVRAAFLGFIKVFE